jgi:hypothetical protein
VSLEAAIREAARSGRLDRTSIVRDPAGRGWQANAPSQNSGAWSVHIAADPVEALLGALRPEPQPTPSGGIFD